MKKEVQRLLQDRGVSIKEEKIRIDLDVKLKIDDKKSLVGNGSYSKTIGKCIELLDQIENMASSCKEDAISCHDFRVNMVNLFEKGKK